MFDHKIIDKCDDFARWAQRRHGANLVAWRVWFAFAGLICTFLDTMGSPTQLIFGGVCFGLALWVRVKIYQDLGDYPESEKKTRTLNIMALITRESTLHLVLRSLVVGFSVGELILLVLRPTLENLLNIPVWITLILLFYAETCMALGPGEHGKEKVEAMPPETVPQSYGA